MRGGGRGREGGGRWGGRESGRKKSLSSGYINLYLLKGGGDLTPT